MEGDEPNSRGIFRLFIIIGCHASLAIADVAFLTLVHHFTRSVRLLHVDYDRLLCPCPNLAHGLRKRCDSLQAIHSLLRSPTAEIFMVDISKRLHGRSRTDTPQFIMTNPLQLATLSLTVALSAYFGPILFTSLAPHLQPWVDLLPISRGSTSFQCAPHNYTTTLISLSPLLIYIHNFISPVEASAMVDLGIPLLQPSPITGYGSDTQGTQHRTSWSAPLPVNNSLVDCILARSESFMGTLLLPGRDNMGQAQLVRYTEGQKFDLHHDWFSRPRLLDEDAKIGRRRLYNRIATIFLTLQADNITEGTGETWFPYVKPITSSGADEEKSEAAENEPAAKDAKKGAISPWWREHEDGGMAFKAIPGNALFWVNMFPNNGSGDGRTLHAGLPVKGGVKTAMNIWPRVFFGPDA